MPSTRVKRGIVMLLALVCLGGLALAIWLSLALVAIAPQTRPGDLFALVHATTPPVGSVAAKVRQGDRVTMLLLARGGEKSENPNLTDTVLLLSFGGKGQPVMVSLPRWLSVGIPAPPHGELMGQLYAAYAMGAQRDDPQLSPRWRTATGGGDLAAATVAKLTGTRIDGWILIDIGAFRALVDALGGIRVTVPAPLDDPRYPVDDSARVVRIQFDAGPQWMDGERALQYARSRLSTSDIDRSRRQELVLTAIFDRLSSKSIGPDLIPVAAALRRATRTNLHPADLRELAAHIGQGRLRDSRRINLEDSALLRKDPIAPGAYIVLPRDASYRTLRGYLARLLSG